MTYWKSPSFKALQITWYKRLEEAGFQDAEEFVGDEAKLKQYCALRNREARNPCNDETERIQREAREEYFALLSKGVNDSEFSGEVDRLIMTLYASGIVVKAIHEELKKLGEPRCKRTIHYTIRKYEMKWGIRFYSPSQMRTKRG